jgi:Flp pilus assembly pilin Flp
MGAMTTLRRWWSDESGAVTVDWVVLTAGLVMAGLALLSPIRSGTKALGDALAADLKADLPTIIR